MGTENPLGEEYTLVAVAGLPVQNQETSTVSNLSSTKALQDVTEKYGCSYYASAVGEVNVVAKMKEVNAVIGGEGNGGIIVPDLHYGRDALAGIALFLTHLAHSGRQISTLRKTYPDYAMAKTKLEYSADIELEKVFTMLKDKYHREEINTEDGLKINFEDGWVHLRPSNTEPIIRVYAESHSDVIAFNLAKKIVSDIGHFV
ncbi:MAG: hypothetical protein R2778_02190 [Saprospiraceae bacterium]